MNKVKYLNFEAGEIFSILVGDNGYPAFNYLLTPIINSNTQPSNAITQPIFGQERLKDYLGNGKINFDAFLMTCKCLLTLQKQV